MKSIIACVLLAGCTYRSNTGSFTNDPPPANMPAAYPPQLHEPAPTPTVPPAPTCNPMPGQTRSTLKPCAGFVFDAQ